MENVWFQQNGAPPHFDVAVRNFLNETFPGQWIGRRGSLEWPPRSPHLSPLGYFYWGFLKSKVYETKPANINELKERTINVSNSITREMLAEVRNECYLRMEHYQVTGGRQFEYLIK